MVKYVVLWLCGLGCLFSNQASYAEDLRRVELKDGGIYVDEVRQPQLFGAEFQYFRLRGGYGKNIDRQAVISAWDRGLNLMLKARMNVISFYIPWDFHEYEKGKFDFTGTVDTDNDGRPDYPSRDLITFLKLVTKKGFKRIMVRPGPYINAEWGFLGFGAIPEWFHNEFPNSHMQSSSGLPTKLYDYLDPNLLEHTRLWFEALYKSVLSDYIGTGKPVVFLQLDNETNFMWQSIFNHNYSPAAVSRYRAFLKTRYTSPNQLGQAYGQNYETFESVFPPVNATENITKVQDWYRFQDFTIFEYLKKIRKIWENLGVREPEVFFTLAESYNAMLDGLLPNFEYRNYGGQTGAMTMNMYPKTTPHQDLFDYPFKSDHDILAVASANRFYTNELKDSAVIAPEVHTGWWRGHDISEAARKQTYLTALGRGVKALFLYYFTEGYNWQSEWASENIRPLYKWLRVSPLYSLYEDTNLPSFFWKHLQSLVDKNLMIGFDAKHVLSEDQNLIQELYFDAPVNKDGFATRHFNLLEKIGEKIIAPYQGFLGEAETLYDSVAIIKDAQASVPSPYQDLDTRAFDSDFSAGLVGFIQQTGVNPTIHHWRLNPKDEIFKYRYVFVHDTGTLDPELIKTLANYVGQGGILVNYMGDGVAKLIGAPVISANLNSYSPTKARFLEKATFDVLGAPLFTYVKPENPLLTVNNQSVGYRFAYGEGQLYQIGAIFHDIFNSRHYERINDVPQRRQVLDLVFNDLQPNFRAIEAVDKVTMFARTVAGTNKYWLTIKSGQRQKVSLHVKMAERLFGKTGSFRVKNVFTDENQDLKRSGASKGFLVNLDPFDSQVFYIEAL